MYQILNALVSDIEAGELKKEYKLPSISLVRKTALQEIRGKSIQAAKKKSYIASFPGRGYFVLGSYKKQCKALLIFNKLSSFKKIIYESLVKALAGKAKVDLQIHHYNPKRLKEILEENLGKYDYYVIMRTSFQTLMKRR